MIKAEAPLFQGSDWDFDLIQRIHDCIEPIACEEMGLEIYPNQIEVITSEQMLDAYASTGMPMMYSHWSFGKHFLREQMLYRKGMQSLAYELVINSKPCVSYIMEDNTATMQTLVLAHAAFGHNHFFKNNHLFQSWTRADAVLDDLAFAKRFIGDCNERHGETAVEELLDAAHALMNFGVSKYSRRRRRIEEDRHWAEQRRRDYDDILERTRPTTTATERDTEKASPFELPEENLLLFLAEHAPKLQDWERQILHIVRRLSQYFYPQRQTKVMNEGCATFVHYEIMQRMYERGLLTEGAMLEFLRSHTAVVAQPNFNDRRYSGLNPYALGFAMMRDIQRICDEPDEEDKRWFPDFAGCKNSMDVLKAAWEEFRDESFIHQFLSPRLIREMHLFAVDDDADRSFLSVSDIHDEAGYREIRRALAANYDLARRDPEIEAVEADMSGDRRLILRHRIREGRRLDSESCHRTLCHVARLWGYQVRLVEEDFKTGKVCAKHEAVPLPRRN